MIYSSMELKLKIKLTLRQLIFLLHGFLLLLSLLLLLLLFLLVLLLLLLLLLLLSASLLFLCHLFNMILVFALGLF